MTMLLDEGQTRWLLARDAERVNHLVAKGAVLVQGDALDEETVQKRRRTASRPEKNGLSAWPIWWAQSPFVLPMRPNLKKTLVRCYKPTLFQRFPPCNR